MSLAEISPTDAGPEESARVSGRSGQILARFPAHMEAARRGKLLGDVVTAVAGDLDMLSARLAAIRRAHRLADADELTDLLLIAARHGITRGELELLFMRFDRARRFATDLEQTSDDASRNAAAEALVDLWAVAEPHPRLPLFAAPVAGGGSLDLNAAKTRLLVNVTDALHYRGLTEAVRTRVGRIAALHAEGNGTVRALLAGAANALDLQIGPIVHSDDRFWHAARVTDRLRLSHPVPAPTPDDSTHEALQALPAAAEIIGIEENPLWRNSTDNSERRHGDLFNIPHRGFERSLLQIRITGVDNGRTLGPMLVNRDEGEGIGFTGTVPADKTLVFDEDGQALLDGADVSAQCFAWKGACFAETNPGARLDFVFDGPGLAADKRAAHFVKTTSPNALDRRAIVPEAGDSLQTGDKPPPLGIAIGLIRFAFFVQEAHFGSREGSPQAPVTRTVTPRIRAAILDRAVFAPLTRGTGEVAAKVALSWIEHRAFTVRLLIPPRFRKLEDDAEGTNVRRWLGLAVERFRPVGIDLRIEFIDDRWVLGESQLASGNGDLIQQLKSATTLWEAPIENAHN